MSEDFNRIFRSILMGIFLKFAIGDRDQYFRKKITILAQTYFFFLLVFIVFYVPPDFNEL